MTGRIVGFLIGVVLGCVLWFEAAPAYNVALAAATEPLLRIDRRFATAELVADQRAVRVAPQDTTTLPPASIPADQLTYNIILLVALFAANPRPWRGRNLGAFALSLIPVALGHVLALLISIESTYALRLGAWSDAHYGSFAMNAWLVGELFLRVVGMFAIVFACWWLAGSRIAVRHGR